MATKAQVEALRWLIDRGLTEKIPAAALMGLYEERYAQDSENLRFGIHISTNRRHAWRRTSGRVLGRMKDAGLTAYDGLVRYGFDYKITDAGFEAAGRSR